MAQKKYLLVIVGPTAVGKTDTCISLARKFGTEIISSDSRQCFQEMNIGVAKPTLEEQAGIPHHLLDFLPITTPYSAGAFARDVYSLLDTLFQKHDFVIMTGGSGLYIDAVCQGLPYMPEVTEEVYKELYTVYAEEGLDALLKNLQKADPAYYAQVDKSNAARIIRALGVCRVADQPFSYYRQQPPTMRPSFSIIKIGLKRDRETLYERINQRVDLMMAAGLWEEASRLYPYKDLPSLATIGYQEVFGALEGRYSKEEAIEAIKKNTRHYAKRQETYFRRDKDMVWFDPSDLQAIEAYITKIQA